MRGGKEVQAGDTILYYARERIANAQDITGDNRIQQEKISPLPFTAFTLSRNADGQGDRG